MNSCGDMSTIHEACATLSFKPELRNAYICEGGVYPSACCKGPAEIDFKGAVNGAMYGKCRFFPDEQDELAVE